MEPTDTNNANEVKSSSTKALTLRVNPWWLNAVLLAGLVATLLMWHPWTGTPRSSSDVVTVSGTATITAEPDEYVFYPSYEFKNSDKAVGLAELTAKSEEVVAGLKKAGVADKDIKTNASGYRNYYYYNEESRAHTYALQVTATTRTRETAQKVQDYLLTTDPSGAVTPQATFSKAKQKELEAKGRDQATKEARTKADQQAKNLGFKVGKVKSVQDSNNDYGYPMPLAETMDSAKTVAPSSQSLAVQPGENNLTYTVQVTYYIR
ncbi:SIMPL domain-containing protein [Candidatus Saccharibacteria bacterium]|nr:MAG: SIMPL domain-containing protein [Candidatus Saccharibacteria bacterium]